MGSGSKYDGEDVYSCGISHEALEGKIQQSYRMHDSYARVTKQLVFFAMTHETINELCIFFE